MEPTTALGIGSAVLGSLGSIFGYKDQMNQTRERNQQAVDRYVQQLKIRQRANLNSNQLFATKLSQYNLSMDAADRAAARAYGAESIKEVQRLKSALVSKQKINRAAAKVTGLGAASGRSGRSIDRGDRNREESYVVKSREMINENVFGAEVARQYREMGIADQLTSARNRAFSSVAIAPTVSEAPLEPAQLSGPSSAGMMLGIGQSILGGVGLAMEGMSDNPFGPGGNGGGGDGVTGNYNAMSAFYGMEPNYNSNINYNVEFTPAFSPTFFKQ